VTSEKGFSILVLGRKIMDILNSVIVILTTVATVITVGTIAYDIYSPLITGRSYDFAFIQELANKIVFLFVYVEVLRTVIAARRKPEMYVESIGEVGFIIAVREVIKASISGSAQDLILASVSALAFASILLIMHKYIIPIRKPTEL